MEGTFSTILTYGSRAFWAGTYLVAIVSARTRPTNIVFKDVYEMLS